MCLDHIIEKLSMEQCESRVTEAAATLLSFKNIMAPVSLHVQWDRESELKTVITVMSKQFNLWFQKTTL